MSRNRNRSARGTTTYPITKVIPLTAETLNSTGDKEDLITLLKSLPTKDQVVQQYTTIRDCAKNVRGWSDIKELKKSMPELLLRVKGTEKTTYGTNNLVLLYKYKNICGKITIGENYSYTTAYVNVISNDGKIKYKDCFYSDFNPLKTQVYSTKKK